MSRRWPDFQMPLPQPWTWRDGIWIIGFIIFGLFITAMFLVVSAGHVEARWKPEYANAPKSVRDWYKNAELTKAAQARLRFIKCCAHSDVVKTKFKVDRSTGKDIWLWLDPGDNKWHVVPQDIIHYDQHAPGGKPVLFVYMGIPTCFFLPDPGI